MHIKKSSLVSIAAMVAITIPLSSCVEDNVDMSKILKAMQQDSRFRGPEGAIGPEGPRGPEGAIEELDRQDSEGREVRKKEETLKNQNNIKENTQLPNELTDKNSTETKK